jgi:hypothetical protein
MAGWQSRGVDREEDRDAGQRVAQIQGADEEDARGTSQEFSQATRSQIAQATQNVSIVNIEYVVIHTTIYLIYKSTCYNQKVQYIEYVVIQNFSATFHSAAVGKKKNRKLNITTSQYTVCT